MTYVSAVVITTLGLGDIVPISPMARTLVAAEAVIGILLAGLFLNALASQMSKREDRK
ncbi:two pore domain potassium channel family protein [Rhizobium leguminosarum bv. viciae]|nr:two pore domain potassium channel family protein [Rhizobium leguminosarum bv. viciae]TCA01194.1 two pore domain potassium channel family protein [Rhizobium leguminosarum bv. viciae]TCA14926.1 two pore domain potassium channel family protein [Rhizobium leguminosarum bv. viciae]